MDFGYEILDAADPDVVYLRARSRMVQLDQKTHLSRPFTPDERAALETYREDAPALRGW